MTTSADLVHRIVTHLFTPGQVEHVLAELLSCSESAPPSEQSRVQVAVLKLYDEDPKRDLLVWTRAAAVDYRDVLLWAEYPSRAQVRNFLDRSPAEQKAMRAEDRRLLKAWLDRVSQPAA
jgi:hypothetical protein